MKLTKKTIELICDLERIIGRECYNPNSLNGYTWEEGCSFRYPVWYETPSGTDVSTKARINAMDKAHIDTIRYKFGSNHLYIGNAIVNVLNHLEATYGISFDELVKKQ